MTWVLETKASASSAPPSSTGRDAGSAGGIRHTLKDRGLTGVLAAGRLTGAGIEVIRER